MINTYKESDLHRTLKAIYALNEDAETEVQKDGFIYDILTKKDEVIEIQTQNPGKLLKKIQKVLSLNKKCTVVFPLIVKKTIETYSIEGNLIKKTHGTKKENEYTMLKNLTSLYSVLLQKNFTLKVPFITITEKRRQTKEAEQSENGRRRFKKNWQKENKYLNELLFEKTFSCKKDYISLLPKNLPKIFCAKDIKDALKSDVEKPKNAWQNANLIAWLFVRMNIFKYIETKGKTKYYKLKNE